MESLRIYTKALSCDTLLNATNQKLPYRLRYVCVCQQVTTFWYWQENKSLWLLFCRGTFCCHHGIFMGEISVSVLHLWLYNCRSADWWFPVILTRLEKEEPSSPKQTLMQKRTPWPWGRPWKDSVLIYVRVFAQRHRALDVCQKFHLNSRFSGL